MQSLLSAIDLSGVLPLVSTLCHIATAAVAVTSGAVTYRYTKQQSALNLLNHQLVVAQSAGVRLTAAPDPRVAIAETDAGNVIALFPLPFKRHRSAG